MLKLIDDYICGLKTDLSYDVDLMKVATRLIANAPSKEILKNVRKEVCLTEKTFQRKFKMHVGVLPNQFRRISQFNKSFQQLQNGEFTNLADLAFANGYSDQSHFSRTFREFAGITPRNYLDYGK